MTVVAWDGITLASDRMATVGGCKVASINKIHRLKDGSHAAISGMTNAGMAVLHWIETGAKLDDYPLEDYSVCTVIVVSPKGELYQYDGPIALKLDTPFYAIGSGREYALAAMYLGHDACAAVEIANALDQDCGNGVDSVIINPKDVIH